MNSFCLLNIAKRYFSYTSMLYILRKFYIDVLCNSKTLNETNKYIFILGLKIFCLLVHMIIVIEWCFYYIKHLWDQRHAYSTVD